MIDGLVAKRISDPSAQGPLEIELTVTDPGQSALDGQNDQAPAYFTLSVILVIGPPDPNALSYLLPRRLFDRDAPIHVGLWPSSRKGWTSRTSRTSRTGRWT